MDFGRPEDCKSVPQRCTSDSLKHVFFSSNFPSSSMAKIPAYAVALKNDIRASERRMKKHFDESLKHFDGVIESFHHQQRGWKNRMMKETVKRLDIAFASFHKRMIHETKVMVEDIRHEYLGATNDRLSLHDDRLNDHQSRVIFLEEKSGML